MILLSPQLYKFPNSPNGYTFDASGKTEVVINDFLVVGEGVLIVSESAMIRTVNGNYVDLRLPEFPKDNRFAMITAHFQLKINFCVNSGEFVHRQLRRLIEKIASPAKNGMIEIDHKIELDKPIDKIDFMGLKDQFSIFLKKAKKLQQNQRFDTSSKRKSITTPFDQFIKMRNLFTHGRLALVLPEEVFVLTSRERAGSHMNSYLITEDDLTSFSRVASVLLETIELVGEIYNLK